MSRLLSPAQYRVGTVLLVMLAMALLWAIFGSIDIVVQAQGKLVPSSFVKVSQPAEAGPIAELLVRDGQVVKRGDLLARVDASVDESELSAERAELARLSLLVKVQDALLAGRALPSGTDSKLQNVIEEHILRRRAYEDALARGRAAATHAEASYRAGAIDAAKHGKVLEVLKRSAVAQTELADLGLATTLQVDDRQRDLIERAEAVRAQPDTLLSLQAAAAQARAELAAVTSDFQKQLATERSQAAAQLTKTRYAVERLERRIGRMELRAPVDGVINGLTVRGAGQVVSAGSVLMSVVPENEPLIAEVWVRNEDAGFAFPGMEVSTKLAAFPFQKYGWVEGELEWVGADSEVPESMKNSQGEPLFFKARVKLARQALARDGKDYPLKAGMQVTTDIQLGRRSLLEYLTSPLKKAVLEAARER